MDLGKALVSSLLAGGRPAVMKALEFGIKPEFLDGNGKDALTFLYEYVASFEGLPSKDVVEGRTGALLVDVQEPADFFIREVLNLRLHNGLRDGIDGAIEKIKERNPVGVLEHLEAVTRDSRKAYTVGSPVQTFPSLGKDVIDLYERIKAGVRGILTPWPTFNEETFGFWPQDMILFVARLGKGKTWISLILAAEAWKQGKKVLFATTEMSKVKVAQRLLSLHLKLPYDDFRKGRLGAFAEQKFKEGVEELQDRKGFDIVGGDFDFKIEAFSAAVDQVEPDIIILDGAYLLRVEGGSRIERAANAFDEMKRLANRKKVPLVATHQFNRDVKGNVKGKMKVESIGLTDVAGWNADLIYGVEQTEEMKKDKWISLQPLKMREGPGTMKIDVQWDFDAMNFTEIPQSGADAGDATDDFGTGLENSQDPGSSDPGTGSSDGSAF